MIVDVPSGYSAEVVGKGCRKPAVHTLRSSVSVELASLSAADAPVALRWHKGSSEPVVEYRRGSDGDLNTAVLVEYFGKPTHQLTLDDALAAAKRGRKAKGGGNPFFAGIEFGMIDPRQFKRAAELEPGSRIVRSTENEVAAKISSIAAGLLVVDGRLYRKDPGAEPIYQAREGEVATFRLDEVSENLRDARRYFRVDQISDVLAAADVGHPINRPEADFDFDDPETYRGSFDQFVEVFDPSVLAYRPDPGAVLIASAHLFLDDLKGGVAEAPLERMVAYGRLRDALDAKAEASEVCELMEALAVTTDASLRDDILSETQGFRMSPVPEYAPHVGGPRP